MTIRRRLVQFAAVLGSSLMMASNAGATWSICIADSNTKEVAVGTVTCLDTFDLLAIVPVIVVGKGSGACQAAGDFGGSRRPVIFNGLMAGTDPAQILVQLSAIGGHQGRQYGIADTLGRTITFTGSTNNQWAGGVTGTVGTIAYAIQGNILVGSCVVPAIEDAVRDTPGDIPAKLMAGMQAARLEGGDGRCSCDPGMPESCGCPPAVFTKSGHIGGMIVSRIGDTDDPVCSAPGCADGNYFMRLNVSFQTPADPDPVVQLQGLFDAWRSPLNGRPDAVASLVELTPEKFQPLESAMATMDITLLDWSGAAITATIQSVIVTHAPGSAGISTIGSVVDNGGGQYTVTLTSGAGFGQDRFRITVNDGIRPVILMPEPVLTYSAPPLPAVSGNGLAGVLLLVLVAAAALFTRRLGSAAVAR